MNLYDLYRHLDGKVQRPKGKNPFDIKCIGKRRKENALIYLIPSNTGKSPYEKGVTESEWKKSCDELKKTGSFTKIWFKQNLPKCNKEGGCNFTFIGGVFIRLGWATYAGPGRYVATANL